MLNFDVIRTSIMQSFPYRYALIENLLPIQVSKELAASYPQQQFQESKGEEYGYLWAQMIADSRDIHKMWQLDTRWQQRIQAGIVTANLQNFSSIWQQFIQELWQPAYREALENLSGLQLKNCPMVISFRKYDPGHRHHPHTDEPSKVLTHLFYFNQQWSADWGGCLRILNSQQPESVFQDILPLSHSSVVIVRSDNSWHTVTPVSAEASECRLVLRVAFFNDIIP